MEKEEIVLYRTFDSPVRSEYRKRCIGDKRSSMFFVQRDIFECLAFDKFGSGSHQAECLCRRRGEVRYYFKYDTTS